MAVSSDDSATLTTPPPVTARSLTTDPTPGDSATTSAGGARGRASATAADPWATAVEHDQLFAPGSIIAERYRIVARLGRGGMGEVFRADDLKVGQPVALKFLPRAMSDNPAWLDRFRGEVRIARQVGHPNVCRVYDLGEASTSQGRRIFLSMEYIDGEDMGTLLRRIGRLPTDKAVQVARQIGAGLAAAHTQGVIHRDLKPANIMLDGRGQARIMDFGVAGLADHIDANDIRSGTPAYMAPEQTAGREVSVRSDVYSFGLVLYELFTGRRAFDEETLRRSGGSRVASEVSRPSTHAHDIDPAVDGLIMRCLREDPTQRPASAMAVIAGLPGADPLRAALEAGETPSPELVAAAGERGALPWTFVAALAGAVALLILAASIFTARQSVLFYTDLPKPPAVLQDRAAEMARSLGYTDKPADTAWGLGIRSDYITMLSARKTEERGAERFVKLRTDRPQPVLFWYRQSPEPMVPLSDSRSVTQTDPPRTTPGMIYIALDQTGRLETFTAVTERIVPADEAEGRDTGAAGTMGQLPVATAGSTLSSSADTIDVEASWRKLFELAGLDFAAFKAVEPRRTPPTYADARAAWEGSYTGQPDQTIHVEAAAYRGRPIYFITMLDSEVEPATAVSGDRWWNAAMRVTFTTAVTAALGFAAWAARRNVRQGRGDMAGARVLGWAMFLMTFIAWVLEAKHQGEVQKEWNLLINGMALPLLLGWLSWMLYLALEPFVRRRDPVMLVSWTRLLTGGVADPVVGRDVLIGMIGGLAYITVGLSLMQLSLHMNWPGGRLTWPLPGALAGWTGSLTATVGAGIDTVFNGMLIVFVFVMLLTLVKNKWIAAVIVGVVAALLISGESSILTGPVRLIAALATGFGLVVYLVRFGLLSILVAMLVAGIFQRLPATADLGEWYAQGAWVGLIMMVAMAVWGMWAARGGRWQSPVGARSPVAR